METTNDPGLSSLPSYFSLARHTPIIRKRQRPGSVANQRRLTPSDLEFLQSFAGQPANARSSKLSQAYSLLSKLSFFKQFKHDRSKRLILQSLKTCSYLVLPAGAHICCTANYSDKACLVLEGTLALAEETADGCRQVQCQLISGTILEGTTAGATVVAVETSHLLVLETKQYCLAQGLEASRRVQQISEALRRLLPFSNFDNLWTVASEFRKVTFQRGEAVFLEGNSAHTVYYVDSGEVTVSKAGTVVSNTNTAFPLKPNPLLQKQYAVEFTLSVLASGALFGAEELACRQPTRVFSCHCSQDAVLYKVPLDRLQAVLQSSQNKAKNLENVRDKLEARLTAFNQQVKLFCRQNSVKPFTLNIPEVRPVSCKQEAKGQSLKYIYTPRAVEVSVKLSTPVIRAGKLNLSLATYLGEREAEDYRPPLKSVLKHGLSSTQASTPARPRSRSIFRSHAGPAKLRDSGDSFTASAMTVVKRTFN